MEYMQDAPDTLLALCLKQTVRNPVYLDRYRLPTDVSHLLVDTFRISQLYRKKLPDTLECQAFYNLCKPPYINLTRINFSNLPIEDDLFKAFLKLYRYQLTEIDISNCKKLTSSGIREAINKYFCKTRYNHSPKSFIAGSSLKHFSCLCLNGKWCDDFLGPSEQAHLFDHNAPIEKFVLHNLNNCCLENFTTQPLKFFMTQMMDDTLSYLDLSYSWLNSESTLANLRSLKVLILYECRYNFAELMRALFNTRTLKVLDVSKLARDLNDDEMNQFMGTLNVRILEELVVRLRDLRKLDVSGTNLVHTKENTALDLESRQQPFEFLGLFRTAYRPQFSATAVAGEANEKQLLTACEAYLNRPDQLCLVLKELNNYYKSMTVRDTVIDTEYFIQVILPIITRHLSDQNLMVQATQAVWWVIKLNVTQIYANYRVGRIIMARSLDVMCRHKDNKSILFNGVYPLVMTLEHLVFEYRRVAEISLHMCKDIDPKMQSWGTSLLNALSCQVSSDLKVRIGEYKIIETMIDIIKSKIEADTCDEVLETAWSTLWNLTDETKPNCKRFLEADGLNAFVACMNKFGEHIEVVRNIMGLLGNVAECPELRTYFMGASNLNRFNSLLASTVDGIECCYNTCGLLANLMAEGDKFWKNIQPSLRQEIRQRMHTAIMSWPINSRRNINYRSFNPLVRLISVDIDPNSQLWSVWALTNLTRTNPATYCPMLERDGALARMKSILLFKGVDEDVKKLIDVCIYQFEKFSTERTLGGLENCDSIEMGIIQNFRVDTEIDSRSEDSY